MMKRLRRLLWVVKGGLVVLCLALICLRLRSYWREDWLIHAQAIESEGQGAVEMRGLWFGRGWVSLDFSRRSFRLPEQSEQFRSKLNEMGLSPGLNHQSLGPEPHALRFFMDEGSWGPVVWGGENPRPSNGRWKRRYVRIRYWPMTILCGAWPVMSLMFASGRAVRRRRIVRKGLCQRCGYDVRATPDEGGELLAVCPECGWERAGSARDARG